MHFPAWKIYRMQQSRVNILSKSLNANPLWKTGVNIPHYLSVSVKLCIFNKCSDCDCQCVSKSVSK